jgi:hypothetical protein
MRALTKTMSFAAAAGIVLALSACGPRFDQLDMDVTSSPPAAVTVGPHQIDITSGVAVVVHAEPISSSPVEYEADDEVELLSGNTEVLEVLRGQTEREFAVVGVWPGETDLVVKVNGKVCDHIPFRCTAFDDTWM